MTRHALSAQATPAHCSRHETQETSFSHVSPATVFPSQHAGTHLCKWHILRQPLLDVLHPLPGEAEGTEVCHQPTHAMLHHELGQHILGVAQQQVEGDVQLCALLQRGGKGYGMVARSSADPVPPPPAEGTDLPPLSHPTWASLRQPYLGHLPQAPQHETVVADGGIQELGHQAEADTQRQLLFEGQALGVEESPVIWGESAGGSVGGRLC